MRMLEGEIWVHNGIAYIVKGFQHPEGWLIAFPRYDLHGPRRIDEWLVDKYINIIRWECLKLNVPVIPLSSSHPLQARLAGVSEWIARYLSSILGVSERDIYASGSSRITLDYRDVDLVVYGVREDLVWDLKKLVEKGVLKRAGKWALINEYASKHSRRLTLSDYLFFKRNTILHLDILGFHVNLRLVAYTAGIQGCLDPVVEASSYNGVVRINEPLMIHITPSRYSAKLDNGVNVILETFREVYSELEPGEYVVRQGRLEARGSGLYLVPDHGVLSTLR